MSERCEQGKLGRPNRDGLGGTGLGIVSEQAIESIHRVSLKSFGKKRMIKDMKNPVYGENMRATVVELSSEHI